MMHLGWPQVIFCIWIGTGLGICAAKNGQPREGKFSFTGSVMRSVLLAALLYWGGFFG